MKKRGESMAGVVGWVLWGAVVMGGCALRAGPHAPPAPDTSGVVAVGGRGAQGQVCPVTPTRAWTAAHVSEATSVLKGYEERPLMLEIHGEPVLTVQLVSDSRRDVSWIELVGEHEFEKVYEVSKIMPEKGDWVWIVGFDVEEGFTPQVVAAQVINVRNGRLYYDHTPGQGSSGSCVLNEKGEVVGVNTSMWMLVRDGREKVIGSGYVIVGRWGEIVAVEEGE